MLSLALTNRRPRMGSHSKSKSRANSRNSCLLAATPRLVPRSPSLSLRRSQHKTVRRNCVTSLSATEAAPADSVHKHKRKGGQQLSRKEARKQARDGRKQRKAQFFAAAPTHKPQPNDKRHAEEDHADSPQRKKAKLNTAESTAVPRAPALKSALKKEGTKVGATNKPKTALEKLVERKEGPSSSRRQSKTLPGALPRTAQEEEEDAYIAYLERKLGYVKGSKRTGDYGLGDEDDGLDGACSCFPR